MKARTCRVLAIVSVFAVLGLAGCSRQQQPAPVNVPPPPDRTAVARAAWTEFTSNFIESYFKAHPFFAVQAGRHEFDGQMGDWSAAGIHAEVQRLKQLRTTAQGMSPEPLGSAQRFEREYLLSIIDRDLFWLDEAQEPFRNPAWYINNLDPQVYLTRD